MLYQRKIYARLESELEKKEVTVVTGMRRVGKTTALEHLFNLVKSKNKAIFDLENPLRRKLFEEENYDAIWNNLNEFGISNQFKAYIFLDEVQNLPQISSVVKYLYDHWDVKFVLTGSSSYYLKNLFPESLAGRKIIFEMFPLDFSEFLAFKGIFRKEMDTFRDKSLKKSRISHETLIPYYNEFVKFGGFPSVILETNFERKKILLSEIFTSYFEKDAKSLSDFNDMSKLRDLILLLVPRTASRLDINKLSNELSISRNTIYSYLSFLEQTYFISLLPKHSKSMDRQAAGSRKLFLCDSGIAGLLGKVSHGQLIEQSIFQSLRSEHKLSFYNKDEANEIDFIIDDKIALEVKTSASRRDIENLRRRSLSNKISEYYVVSEKFNNEKEVILATDL